MSNAVAAFGTKFSWNTHEVAELTNIEGPTQTMDTIDVTSHDSADAFKEFIAGLRDGGDISIEGNFIHGDTNGQIAMMSDFQAVTKRAWTITGPSSHPSIAGNGYITALNFTFPYADKIGFKATVKITGKPTVTA